MVAANLRSELSYPRVQDIAGQQRRDLVGVHS
jgi:hypothetical protein